MNVFMTIMIFWALILISISALLLERYLKVNKINKKTLQLIKLKIKNRTHPLVKRLKLNSSIQNNLKKSLNLTKKEAALGGAFAGMSLLDIYTMTNKHQEVLQAIENRLPNEMGDANSIKWLNKVTQLKQNNSSQSYINYYTGEKAEIESIDRLKELGYENVSQFESKTHPNNDLRAIDSEGNEVYFSVKSHKNTASFEKEVAEHPDSKNYIVNSEVYQEMKESGQLVDYESRDIHIIDGGFFHEEHIQEATVAFEDIGEAVDVSDDIHFIALASLGYKTVNNIIDFTDGKQSKTEFGINVAMDAVSIGGRAVGALGGAKIGATIGTAIAPGIGSVIGGIGGAITGSIATSKIMKDVKEDLKWGDIIEAIEHYGAKYHSILMDLEKNDSRTLDMRKNIVNKIYDKVYNCPQVTQNLKEEKKVYKSHTRFLARWGLIPKSINETLILEHIKSLKKYLKTTKLATVSSLKALQKILKNIEKKLPEDKKDTIMQRYIGEFVIENKDIFIEYSMENTQLLKEYHLEKKECPNHPYKISNNSNKLFKQIMWQTLQEVSV